MKHKRKELQQIEYEILNLSSSPLYADRIKNNYKVVVGEGDMDASVVFVGEAPGRQEAETGRPFCGASGKLLDALLDSIDLNRSDTYVTSIVKDRPPSNRDPRPEEIALYAPYLTRQIRVIQPKVLVTLGRFSTLYILSFYGMPQQTETISALHGIPITVQEEYGLISVVPLYHPAAALYNPNLKKTLFQDIQILKQYLP